MTIFEPFARGCALASVMLAIAGFGSGNAAAQASPQTPPYLSSFPGFATDLTPAFPGDVDMALGKQLEQQKRFAEVQRLFDLNAWQMFLAVNWPTNDQGQPAPSLAGVGFGEPHWTLWQTSSQIYRADGKRPAACDASAASTSPSPVPPLAEPQAPLFRGLPPPPQRPQDARPRSARRLANLSAVGRISVLDLRAGDTSQAFSGPLIDQNGNFVHYEIALDPNEVRYVCETGIYNINGQLAFGRGKQSATLDFPSGTDAQDWSGATELKFAWKIIAGSDRADRFFTMRAHIPDARGGWREVTVGLVGMHISHKSQSSPQWIWATFEQVDNLVGDPLAHPPIRPSFYNPNCPLCVPNQDPSVTNDTTTPTQVVRAIQVPGDKMRLNAEAQAVLAKLGSVWQYYQLIDTQHPTDPAAKPTPWSAGLPGAVENKPGGNPIPVYLTNITMETYFQTGVQAACHREELPSGVACPPKGPDSFPSAIGTQVFATESCMGCHSSAGLYRTYDAKDPRSGTFWPQLSADFSWLPELEAAFDAASTGSGEDSQQAPASIRLRRR